MTNGLAVMYHYIVPDGVPIPSGIRPLLLSEFEQQLDWLCERYTVLPPADFLAQVPEHAAHRRPPCLLTFDDGTRDHAEWVTPVLQRRGLSGVFFVLTWPLELNRMPLTHAVHWLLGQGDDFVWQFFERYAIDRLGSTEPLGSPEEASRIYNYEPPTRGRIKYAANMKLPPAATEEIVAQVAAASGLSLSRLAESWFASAADIIAMDKAGMTIGLHGCSHQSLQLLGPQKIREEIHYSSRYLAELLGKRPEWFACPFGGTGASPSAVESMQVALDEAGVRAAVTTLKQPIRPDCNPRALPRLDAIDVPPRAPALKFQ